MIMIAAVYVYCLLGSQAKLESYSCKQLLTDSNLTFNNLEGQHNYVDYLMVSKISLKELIGESNCTKHG